MKIWNCYNCNTRFTSDTPRCVCGADPREDEMVHLVVQAEIIHYAEPHPVIKDRSTRARICDNAKFKADPRNPDVIPWVFACAWEAVTCPNCQAKRDNPAVEEKPNGS